VNFWNGIRAASPIVRRGERLAEAPPRQRRIGSGYLGDLSTFIPAPGDVGATLSMCPPRRPRRSRPAGTLANEILLFRHGGELPGKNKFHAPETGCASRSSYYRKQRRIYEGTTLRATGLPVSSYPHRQLRQVQSRKTADARRRTAIATSSRLEGGAPKIRFGGHNLAQSG